eukprot:3700525-Amphidinium_carterae.1
MVLALVNHHETQVRLNNTIPRGQYVFALPITPPLATPLWNYHSITLHDMHGVSLRSDQVSLVATLQLWNPNAKLWNPEK